jgi:peptide methionine sulfoxide reductase MsrB
MSQSPNSNEDVETTEAKGDGAVTESKPSPKTRNPLRLAVLRLGVTEPRATSPYNYGGSSKYKDGVFACGYCGVELFDGAAKYESGSGWPSFWRSVRDGAVTYQRELDGRLECQCGTCKRCGPNACWFHYYFLFIAVSSQLIFCDFECWRWKHTVTWDTSSWTGRRPTASTRICFGRARAPTRAARPTSTCRDSASTVPPWTSKRGKQANTE